MNVSEANKSIEELFPFPDFREHQRGALNDAADALWEDDADVVILDIPTGVGKSAINTTLGRRSDSAYITTPERKLRWQLSEDDVLRHHYEVLHAREDYTCAETGDSCHKCEYYTNPELDCSDAASCTYESELSKAVSSPITTTTFARLVIDGMMDQPSFGERELLVVDEGHKIEGQTASLFAGFTISPYTVPTMVYDAVDPDPSDPEVHHDVWELLMDVSSQCKDFVGQYGGSEGFKEDVQKSKNLVSKISYLVDEAKDGRTWVVNQREVTHPATEENVPVLDLKPVRVDRFLQRHVWNFADKVVLSTATVPYSDDPERWCRRLGLDGNVSVIRTTTPFERENRFVRTCHTVGKLSGGREYKVWDELMEKLDELADRHNGKKGIVHTSSYNRAHRIWDSSDEWDNLEDNVVYHDRGYEQETVMKQWQGSDKDILVTPSMTEGVDLEGDSCRWQVLFKVPFPNISDARTDYLINEKNQWNWMYETTANSIVQAAGRAVRSKDDWAEFYVLDESFEDVRSRVGFPDWFEEAITPFDYPAEW